MTFPVALAPSAAPQLRKFDSDVRRRMQAAIELLAVEPRPPAATRLVGGLGEWRVRTGNYRIVYEINDNELVVLVLRMGHRRDVYEAVVKTREEEETAIRKPSRMHEHAPRLEANDRLLLSKLHFHDSFNGR